MKTPCTTRRLECSIGGVMRAISNDVREPRYEARVVPHLTFLPNTGLANVSTTSSLDAISSVIPTVTRRVEQT